MSFVGDQIIIDYAADYAMALPSKIPDLLNFLGFNSEIADVHLGTIIGNLRVGNPVIFKARTPGFAGISLNHHIWVCEGYRNSGYSQYYMYLGWRGSANGWYYINNWQPNGSDSNYSEGRQVIYAR